MMITTAIILIMITIVIAIITIIMITSAIMTVIMVTKARRRTADPIHTACNISATCCCKGNQHTQTQPYMKS